jgi:uncharacterized delta-60 repeat protein
MRRRYYLVAMVFAGLVTIVSPAVPAWAVTSGDLDPTFGAEGKVLTDVGGQDMAYGMAVQSDGRIVVAGFSNMRGNYDFALARYGGNGTLDPTFGSGGSVLTDVSAAGSFDEARAVAIQPDGKILAAGSADASGGSDFAVVRYNRDGTLDRTFGTGGKVVTDLAGTDYAYAVALCGDGKILAAGSSDAGGSSDFALARYTGDGALDSRFGRQGMVLTDVSGVGSDDEARAVAVQADGDVVAAGRSNATPRADHDFALVRYRDDGSLDGSFGRGGRVLTDVGGGSDDVALAVAVQADRKVVAAGGSGWFRNDNFAVTRYSDGGTLDPTFGAGGTVVTDVSGIGTDDEAFAVAIQPDGKILTAGVASGVGWADFAAARYQS